MVDDCYYRLIGDMDQARILQARVVTLLEDGSRRAGYKVGLTDSKAQEMFGIHQPLVGVLFEEMMLPDGAVVDLDSTTSLLVELDLLARVKSAGVNEARINRGRCPAYRCHYPVYRIAGCPVPAGRRQRGRVADGGQCRGQVGRGR